jgi:sodium/potassium/calcium exchanger 6
MNKISDRGVKAMIEAKQVSQIEEEYRLERENHEDRQSCWDLFMEWLDLPFIFALNLTCLPCQDSQYISWKFFFYGVFGVWWGYWVFTGDIWDTNAVYVVLPICFIFELIFVKKYMTTVEADGQEEVTPRSKVKHNGLTLSAIDKQIKNKKRKLRDDAVSKHIKEFEAAPKTKKQANESGPVFEKRLLTEKLKFRVNYIYEHMHDDPPNQMEWFKWMCTILGVVAGLMWTYVLVGILIDLLNCFGTLLGLDSTYLGLTILAVGNALPDALTTISLCKTGQATMALAGGYAGQLFGLLIGFGLAQFKTTLISGPQVFDLFNPASIDKNMLDLIVLSVAFVCLVFTFLYAKFKKFKMDKMFAYIVLLIYLAFIIACSAIAITNAVNNF